MQQIGIEGYTNEASPVVFWDLYGKLGHPLRTTVSEVGPPLMSRMLELNDIQSGVMDIAFKLADDHGLLLLDLDDLRALLNFVTENRADISKQYGLVSPQSVGAIQRALLRLEQDGGKQFFGEPAVQLADLMRQDMSGRGVINLLAADQLILRPRLYSSFLLWLLSELFETLPEVGDLAVPKLVFFFDEAHLLFDDCPPALRQRVDAWDVSVTDGPVIATAIHDGHALRPEVRAAMALTDAERLREEDPFTGQAILGIPTHVIPRVSRFECDLNGYPRILAIAARCEALDAFKNAAPEVQPDAQ